MSIRPHNLPMSRAALAVALAASTVGLAACNDTSGTETGVDVEDIQAEPAEGPLGGDAVLYEDLSDEIDSYVGERVTVSADVDEVISPVAFTIAGTENTTLEPLLVVGATEFADVEEDMAVSVTGEVHQEFFVEDVRVDLGIEFDDDVFLEWEQEPYLVASEVAPATVDE